MAKDSASAETAYLTSPNIVHPQSSNSALIAALETAARTELTNRHGVTVTGGSIKKGS